MMGFQNVSRETAERLEIYERLLEKWNPAINLVAKTSITNARTRHFEDSLQILNFAPDVWTTWADLGSGGGFPGAVVAIAAAEYHPNANVILVESDARKSAFLRSVFRETGVTATVLNQRIESLDPLGANVVSARALAELSTLLGFANRHAAPNATLLFPKGESWRNELTKAQESWIFSYDAAPSKTDSKGVILKIRDLRRADPET